MDFGIVWNNYKDNAKKFERGDHCMQRHLNKQLRLLSHSGFIKNLSVTLIHKTDPKNPTKPKYFWMHILKT